MKKLRLCSIIVFIAAIATRSNSDTGAVYTDAAQINFCDLIRHPERYDGKTVVVSATLNSSLEGAILFDDTCKPINTEESVIILPTYRSGYKFTSQLDKKLREYLKRDQSAQITEVAAFTDGKGRIFGHLNCCRYKLETQRLLNVEKVKGLRQSILK